MILYQKAIDSLKGLDKVFGFDPATVAQGTHEWKIIKLGVLSASNASKIVAKKDSDTRNSYMAELISEIINCSVGDESSFKQTDWGKNYEPEARDLLGIELEFQEILEVPFIFMDEKMRVGVSPDGVFDNTVCEIKCPYDGTFHVKHMAFEKIKSEWEWQRQFQLYASNADLHVFATYDPRVAISKNMHYTFTEKDDAKQSTLRDAVPQFIHDMDKALEKLGVKFGDHWKYIKENKILNNQ